MTPLYATYAFVDVVATINGPSGFFTVAGPETATAEEGITVTWGEEMNSQTIGADGSVMNTMHASRSGTCNIRLQKVSPINAKLSDLINADRLSSASWGRNLITISDVARGDVYTLTGCAPVRFATNNYAKAGSTMDWEFHVSLIDPNLGPGPTDGH